MDLFRHHNISRRALVVLVMLSLLLQVQEVFACEMMDHSGLAKHCCCDEMKTSPSRRSTEKPKEITKELRELASTCCEFSSELMLKGADVEEVDPASLQLQPLSILYEIPQTTVELLFVSYWPHTHPLSHQALFRDHITAPDHPGTNTYSSTQRLRI